MSLEWILYVGKDPYSCWSYCDHHDVICQLVLFQFEYDYLLNELPIDAYISLM